jgi:hypothetical protein
LAIVCEISSSNILAISLAYGVALVATSAATAYEGSNVLWVAATAIGVALVAANAIGLSTSCSCSLVVINIV